MKKLTELFAVFTVSLFTLNACHNELQPVEKPAVTHSLKFVAEAPSTKTTASIDNDNKTVDYSWTSDDKNRFEIYEISGETYTKANEVKGVLNEGEMTLTATFGGDPVPGASYIALFNTGVKSEQSATGSTYDQQSDVLISKPVTSQNIEDEILELRFKRETAFALMTAKNLEGSSIIGASIVADKKIVAEYDVQSQSFLEPGSKTIAIANGDNAVSSISNGTADVFFASVPVEGTSLKVRVVTCDENGVFKALYEKSFASGKSIDFARGDVRPFGIQMVKCEDGLTIDLTKDETTTATENEMSWKIPGFVSIVAEKAGAGTATNNFYPGNGDGNTHFFKNSTLTFTPRKGVLISSIVFKAGSEGYATALANSTWTNASAKVGEKNIVTITPTLGYQPVSVVLDDNTTGGDSFKINYGIAESHDITVADDIANGSVSANVTSAVPGTEITLTPSPVDHYYLDTWIVTIADTETPVAVTDNKFIMPNAAVNVSAIFRHNPYFEKLTEAPADWRGDYLIVYETGEVAFDGSLETLDAVSNTKEVTIEEGNKIEATPEMKAIQFTVDYKSGSSTVYSLKSASGKYISGTTTNAKASNGLNQADSDANYEISFNDLSIESKSKDQQMVLKYNSANDQKRFRFYKSGQQGVALYKLEDLRTKQALSFIDAQSNPVSEITVKYKGVQTEFEKPTLTGAQTSPVSYTSSAEDVVTVAADGTVSFIGVGTATITATAPANDDYQPGTASYTLNVEKALTGIELNTESVAKEFTVNGDFNYNGLVVTANYSDGTDANVSESDGLVVTPPDMTEAGEGKIVTVTYTEDGEEASKTYKINVFEGNIPVQSVSLSKTETSLEIGGKETLTATITPANASNQTVHWSSSTPSVATVDNNGEVTAIAIGQATITVTSDDNDEISVSCAVTVTPKVVTETISLNNSFYGISTGNNGTEQSKTTDEGVTVVSGCASNAQTKTYYDSGHIRYYANSYLKISVDGTISKIVLSEPSSSKKWDGSISVSPDTYSTDTKTWTGSAAEVDFSFGAQNRIASIEVTFTPDGTTRYDVSCVTVEGGTLSADPSRAQEGASVTLTATPADEYEFNNDWSVTDENSYPVSVTNGVFTMPASNVTVSGSFTQKTYTIKRGTAEHGTFTINGKNDDNQTAHKSDQISLSAEAESGYEHTGWTVTKEQGGTVNVTSDKFYMPADNVTVTPVFTEKALIPEYASLAELVAAGQPSSTTTTVKVTLTNEVITDKASSYICVKSGNQEVKLYKSSVPADWAVGGTVSGTLQCPWVLWGSDWELQPISWDDLTYTPTCSRPTISFPEGKATISATEGATIKYAVNQDADIQPELTLTYTTSFTVNDGDVVWAKATATNHNDSEVVSRKYTASSPVSTTVWQDDFSSCTKCSSTALSSLSGSIAQFNASYSSLSKVYPMVSAVKLGSASAAGSISIPALTAITGTQNLTITLTAAGWNNKSATLTLSSTVGSVSEGATTIESETTMAGNSPTMVGKSYTFHITGATSSSVITISSNLAVGISDIKIVTD